jgi:iron complex transport system ATP-binding protein
MMLHTEDLHVSLKGKRILSHVSVGLDRPGITAILGPNGVGKTTLLRSMNGIVKAEQGQVVLFGRPIHSYRVRERSKLISYVAQSPAESGMRVFDAVLLGRLAHIRYRAGREDRELAGTVIEQLGLSHLAMRDMGALSGGELQKVAIARALVQQSPIMLLDEPTSALDLANQLQILALLKQITEERGIRVMLSIHDINTALRCANRCIFLKDGQVSACVERDDVTEEMVERTYGVPVMMREIERQQVVIPKERS